MKSVWDKIEKPVFYQPPTPKERAARKAEYEKMIEEAKRQVA